MKYYKLGCVWDNENARGKWMSYYEILKLHSIVINNDSEYQIGDYVVIAKEGGFNIEAIGKVISSPRLLSDDIKEEFTPCIPEDELEEDWINFYKVEWIDISKSPLYYKNRKGWCQIKKPDLIKQIDERVMNYQKNKMENILINLLKANKNIILTGAPGTGKTYTAQDIAAQMILSSINRDKKKQTEDLNNTGRYKLVQFHPAYTYEDFVRGIVAETDGNNVSYKVRNKTFATLAEDAAKHEDKPYVLIIDEINRANLPAVLGELIYALEYRDRAIETMYENENAPKDKTLTIPSNLFVIGTMNTADRSAGQVDYAIRRRFAFVPLLPKVLDDADLVDGKKFEKDLFKEVSNIFVKNYPDNLEPSDYLNPEFKPEDVWIGHSYFITDKEDNQKTRDIRLKYELKTREIRLEYEIKPLLREYLKDGILKETAKEKIDKLI